ncbi:Cap-specific mRNA (nucleoside-2'-O-)-methyltransferase 2 [Aphelenchoides besseyi]|nr:Cap-specific mRNA (nucleoside-2'-O-)-methyltransferase 2 [Aphelenchoides besseyi]
MAVDLGENYEQIAEQSLEKVFYLKPSRLKSHDDEDDLEKQMLDEKLKLERCKEEVGEKCKRIGVKKWRGHTMFTHPLKGMADKLKNEFSTLRPTISQAYCKFAEILTCHPELSKKPDGPYEMPFRTLHLAEAPGCFVQAMADFLPEQRRSDWIWRMNSLNPYYEGGNLDRMIYDDCFMLPYQKNMLFGPDNSGSITNWTDEYISYALGETGKFHTITYDGSFDCTDNPSEQENNVYGLISHAWRITTKMLQKNGCAVFKIYTFFSTDMRNFLNQFYSMFHQVILQKPSCSKPGNSEVYLIGLTFRDVEPTNVENSDLKYLLYQATKYFVQHQIKMMEFNLKTVGCMTQNQRLAITRKKQDIQTLVSSRYFHFLQSTVLGKPFLRDLSNENVWQKEAWKNAGQKYEGYEAYVNFYPHLRSTIPIQSRVTWEADTRKTLEINEEILNSIVRHDAVIVTQRSSRFNPVEPLLRITCSLFADFKLMQFAKEHWLDYKDMCSKRNSSKAFRQLRVHFAHQQDSIYIDSPFMSRDEWLEACGSISAPVLLPQSTIAVLLPKNNTDLRINTVHIYLSLGTTFVLSRFAGSVIFFLSLFFEEFIMDEQGAHFSRYIQPSTELAAYIKRVYQDIPSSYDILQFVPTHFLTNISVYSTLLSYNNFAFRTAIETQRSQLKGDSIRFHGDPKTLESMG